MAQWHHTLGCAARDGFLGHAENHAGRLILRNGAGASVAHFEQALRRVAETNSGAAISD